MGCGLRGVDAGRLNEPPTAAMATAPAIDDVNACGMDTSARQYNRTPRGTLMTNPLSRREFLEISACASAMSGALPTGDAPSMARTASAVESSADQAAGTSSDWFTGTMAGRSVSRANQGMVATSQ